MRINGAALNRVALDQGAARLPVHFGSEGVLAGEGRLEGRRRRCAVAQASSVWQADWRGMAYRLMGDGPLVLESGTQLSLSAARSGKGSGRIDSAASLYYTRAVPLAGAAELALLAYGDVGVVFGEGTFVLTMGAAMVSSRCRVAHGEAVARRHGALAASAIRYPRVPDAGVTGVPLWAELDTAHIHAGVRTIDGSAAAVLWSGLRDEGLRRQTLLGSASMQMLSTGEGRVIRRMLPSKGVTFLSAESGFSAWRRGRATVVVDIDAEADGAIFVRGSAEAVTGFSADCVGYAWRRTLAGAAVTDAFSRLTGTRFRLADGQVICVWKLAGEAVRVRVIEGDCILESIGEQDAILNPFAVDDAEQQFVRAARYAGFIRPDRQRSWLRG